MASTAMQPTPPIAALAVAGYGAVLGSLFPVITVLSIADISGGLSVAADSAALVNTVQNVGAIFGILLMPSLFAGIGRRRAMMLAGAGFLITSIARAVAPSLAWMLVARTLQGVFSGTLPLLFMMFVMSALRPGAGQHEGMTLFAASTSLFFGCAATFGAGLVDQFGWRALFWAQAVIALPYVIAASLVLRDERRNPEALRTIDWPSYLPLAFGLAMILFAVAEGERHFWLEAWWVPGLILGGAILVATAIRSLLRGEQHRLIQLSVFGRPTFAWGITLSFFFRFGLLFAIYIVPAFLGRVQGFRPEQVGEVLLLMTPSTLIGLTAAWYFAHRIDSRLLLSAGLAMFSLAAGLCVDLDPAWAVDQLRLGAIGAGIGLGLFGVGVLRFSSHGAGPLDGPTVVIVFNLARVFGNIGGLAILIHLVTEREKFHSAILVESLSATDSTTALRLNSSAGAFGQFSADGVDAQLAATSALGRVASTQAFTLAYADALTITSITLGLGAILVWALPGIPKVPSAQTPQRKSACPPN